MREYNSYERVKINNIYPWSVGFKATCMSQGVSIPPEAKSNIALTVEAVMDAINSQNIAFVGCDGRGTRAAFQIVDPEMREYFFGTQDEPYYYKIEHVKKLLSIKKKADFEKELKILVTNDAEARAVMDACYDPNRGIDIESNGIGWQCDMIKKHCDDFLIPEIYRN